MTGPLLEASPLVKSMFVVTLLDLRKCDTGITASQRDIQKCDAEKPLVGACSYGHRGRSLRAGRTLCNSIGTRAQARRVIFDREPATWINQPSADGLQLAAEHPPASSTLTNSDPLAGA